LINGVATDRTGNVYFTALHCIFKLDPQGMLTRVGGIGRPGESGDGGSALQAQMWTNSGLAVDSMGDIYLSGGSRIRKISANGVITTIAGNGTAGYAGDGAKAIGAELNGAEGIAIDHAGNLYIADRGNNRIRKVSPTGIIATVAGMGRLVTPEMADPRQMRSCRVRASCKLIEQGTCTSPTPTTNAFAGYLRTEASIRSLEILRGRVPVP